jgi:hypothetical protein
METKTDHLRRMRLRRKYWRVTPSSPPLVLTYRGENVMCDSFDVDDDTLEKRHVVARAMLAALKLCVTEMQVNGTRGKLGADAFDGARAAIAQAKAAGIK